VIPMQQSTTETSKWIRNAQPARALALGVALLVVWLPNMAQACAVCFQGKGDDSRLAFIATTAFMTLLPLTVLFFAIRWFVRRANEAERLQSAGPVHPMMRPTMTSSHEPAPASAPPRIRRVADRSPSIST
jgi:hypothetical protein